jgi:hypothetical protein
MGTLIDSLNIAMQLNDSQSKVLNDQEWTSQQMKAYGPMLGGPMLRSFLGFRTQAAFAKARAAGSIGVPTFSIPGRKGVFALTSDVCSWALELRRSGVGR